MVRHKARWLVVHLDFGEQLERPHEQSKMTSPNSMSNKALPDLDASDIFHSLRKCIEATFGTYAFGVASELQVTFYEYRLQIAVIRMSREHCGTVRSAVTLLTDMSGIRVAASVLAVCGSLRTARLVVLHELNKFLPNENEKKSACQGKTSDTKMGQKTKRRKNNTEAGIHPPEHVIDSIIAQIMSLE